MQVETKHTVRCSFLKIESMCMFVSFVMLNTQSRYTSVCGANWISLRMWIYFPQCFLIAQMTTYFLKEDFYFVLKLVIEYFKGSPLGECKANGIEKPCFLSC